MVRPIAALCLTLAACSSGSVPLGGGSGTRGSSSGARVLPTGGSSGGGTSGGASSASGSGGDPCDGACATLVGPTCGVLQGWKSSCVALCDASPAATSCAQAAGSDCNSLALCLLQAACPSECSGHACVPSGTETCQEAFTCANACSGQPAACACGCQGGLDPSKAGALLVASACGSTDCGSECSPSGMELACDNCLQRNCNTIVGACLSE